MTPDALRWRCAHRDVADDRHEAYKAAGDPDEIPRAAAGRPARLATKEALYHAVAARGRRGCAAGAGGAPAAQARRISRVYDPLLGRTYSEIGTEARSMHKCQGMAQLLALPRTGGIDRISLLESIDSRGDGRDETLAVRQHRHQHRRAGEIRRCAAAKRAGRRPGGGRLGRRRRRRRISTPRATVQRCSRSLRGCTRSARCAPRCGHDGDR